MRKYPSYIVKVARDLRGHPTLAEHILWECLRNRRLTGLKFRRQQHFGRYIADFFCAELELVVEVEGSVHSTTDQKEYDTYRFAELSGRGLKILRLTNEEVVRETESALRKILALASEGQATLAPLFPPGEKG